MPSVSHEMSSLTHIIISGSFIYFLADCTQFHGVLIDHLFKVLQERDDIRVDEKEWVVNEAMNPKCLQQGGTFRNVLSRKVDRVVIDFFSEMISIIDRNNNLDLIDPRNENTSELDVQFWLRMFRNPQIMQFNYLDMEKSREQVPGLGGRKAANDFTCQLPFSWVIFEVVNSLWDNANSSGM